MLGQLKPDILCLQEIKAFEDDIPHSERKLSYVKACYHSAQRKGYSGVATFFNETHWKCGAGLGIPDYDGEGRMVWCQTSKVTFLNLYFPNGSASLDRHHFKMRFLEDFYDWVVSWRQKGGLPLIIVGDWNIAPTEKDVWDPVGLQNESGFLPEERAWFKKFLDLGYVDTWRALNPDKKHKFTWWSYKQRARLRNEGWRIDHVIVDQRIFSAVTRVVIHDDIQGSDHCPVSVDLIKDFID